MTDRSNTHPEFDVGYEVGMQEGLDLRDQLREEIARLREGGKQLDGVIVRMATDLERWHGLCQMVDAHYSGSLDHQPAYVRHIRAALDEEQA